MNVDVHVGDKVLFLPLFNYASNSKRMYRGYVVGKVEKVSDNKDIVSVVDNVNDKHVIYRRFVHVIQCKCDVLERNK
jgi:hypothetical protein